MSPATECEVILDEIEAFRQAVSRMAKGEVIVVFYEKLKPIQDALEEFAAQPVVALPRITKRIPNTTPGILRTRRLIPAMPRA